MTVPAANPSVAVVIPTLGRPSLQRLLASLARCRGPRPLELVLVDDRPGAAGYPELTPLQGWTSTEIALVRSGGRGPAAARNVGWQRATAPWIAFLDDDVEVTPDWLERLSDDIASLASRPGGAATQGRLLVPLPTDRAPTDAERNTAGLAEARWITADMCVRRVSLSSVGGFDERFPRAFREDADLALRLVAAGARIDQGTRVAIHPPRDEPWDASLARQRGNADDALMRRLHGRDWFEAAGAPRGAWREQLATVACATVAAGALVARRHRVAAAAAAGWLMLTSDFAWSRIAPGPRTRREVVAMAATSVAIPFAAVTHRVRGTLRWRRARSWDQTRPVGALLVDRDGTVVHDVPYNRDPALVSLVPGAREALAEARAAGLGLAVVTNQSGVARGLIAPHELRAVNRRVEELLGPFDDWEICVHAEGAGCRCRKPAPGMVLDAAAALDVPLHEVVMVGDTGADVRAAEAAGAIGVLVPNATTRQEEIDAARHVQPTIGAAVAFVLDRPLVTRSQR